MPTASFNTHLPGYEVLAELGRGNTRVLKARHVPTGEIVAIKQYAFAADTDTLHRFARESQIMTQINHPNVVRVREVQLGAAMPYVVMDFVEGGDLRGLLGQQGHLDLPTTIRLGLQLTEAFRAMHPLHVIHRDVKPENVLYRRLVSGELHFLLTDFGIAKLRADDSTRTRTGQSLMTYEYAAPEQFDNPRQVDEAADYYALGAVLYECLTGRVPFVLHDENGLGGFMNQVLTAPILKPMFPAGQPLPPGMTGVLMSLLTRNPAHRLRNPDQLELMLQQSRVEHLSANQLPQPAPVRHSQTVVGTGATIPVLAQNEANQSTYVPDNQPGLSRATWWGIGGVGIALALAMGLYIYSDRETAIVPENRPDLPRVIQSGNVPSLADTINPSTETDLPPNEEPIQETIIEGRPRPEPIDSTTTTQSAEDSVTRIPPDSTE